MKVDAFAHIMPAKVADEIYKRGGEQPGIQLMQLMLKAHPTLSNLDHRFRIMDKYDGYMQVLTLSAPVLDELLNPNDVVELAKIANDEMAELVFKYPDRFVAAVATLPMSDLDAALLEADRAIKDLMFRGVQIFTPLKGEPIDSPEYMPLYERMAEYNLPIWIHPQRERTIPDYATEKHSRYVFQDVFSERYIVLQLMPL